MADYWKSNERKYCDFCKCWLSDNKASIAFHESGKRHKLNVAKRITEISKNSEKSERERQKMDADIRKMEDAAMKSYAQDIHSSRDMTARTINSVREFASTTKVSYARENIDSGAGTSCKAGRGRQVDPMRLEGESDEEDNRRVSVTKVEAEEVPNASLWVEGKSEEGHTYYWNVKTNESVWQPPKEGFLSYAEYERINALAEKQQEIQFAEDAKKFRLNADEEVARYNRERLKNYRRPPSEQEQKQKEEKRQSYKTAEEAATNEIGQWQTVIEKPPPIPIDWELPKTENYYVAPVVSDAPHEPPVKRFKEKTIETLDVTAVSSSVPATFKKRKFANKGNARQRLDD